MLMGGCQSIHQPFVCLSVPRLSVAILTVRLSTVTVSSVNCASICPSLSLSTPVFLNIPHRFNPRLPVYPPDRPSVCLSVCLPSLVFPATLNHHFGRRLSVNHPSSFQPPAACLSVCLSVYLSMDGSEARYSPTLTDW